MATRINPNQCDGCRARLPTVTTPSGARVHVDADRGPWAGRQVCTADRYQSSGEAIAEMAAQLARR